MREGTEMTPPKLQKSILSLKSWFVVTKFGWADLKGRSSTERAKALIALTYPECQGGLTAAAKGMHLI
jgi:acyl-CoA hydrolase